MGEIAASFAHELHQPLCAIALYADTCLRLLEAPSAVPIEIREALTDVHRQALRASAIIKQLRRYVQRQAPAVKAVDIAEIVSNALALTDYDSRNLNASIQVRLEPSLPPVLAEQIQIEQVLHNLIRNALEAGAMNPPSDRQIVIEGKRHDPESIEINVYNAGKPLSEATKQQMFRPFFTTKPEGLGIGLYIARLIVTAHHGSIECIPESKGNTMRVILPAANHESARSTGR